MKRKAAKRRVARTIDADRVRDVVRLLDTMSTENVCDGVPGVAEYIFAHGDWSDVVDMVLALEPIATRVMDRVDAEREKRKALATEKSQ